MRSTAIDRRNLLKAGAAGAFALFVPIAGRAGERPAYVAARREADGSFAAVAIDEAGEVLFKESLDGRGHDIALSPDRKLACTTRCCTKSRLIPPFPGTSRKNVLVISFAPRRPSAICKPRSLPDFSSPAEGLRNICDTTSICYV